MQRGELSDALQVHDHEEEDGEGPDRLEQRRKQGRGHRRDPEHRQVHHRLLDAALDDDERQEEHDAHDQRRLLTPREVGRRQFDHRPQDQEQSDPQRDHPGPVDPLGLTLGAVVEEGHGQGEGADPGRHVDPEDPAPRDVGDDDPAEEDPEDGADVPAHRVEPVGPSPPLGREVVGQHRATVGGDERPAKSLQDPEGDDGGPVVGQGAEGRSDDEDQEPGLVHLHPAEHVAEPSHLGGGDGDHQQVADDHPDDRRQRDVERSLHHRQREHHDRRVDGGHQHPDDHDQQHETGLGCRTIGLGAPAQFDHDLLLCSLDPDARAGVSTPTPARRFPDRAPGGTPGGPGHDQASAGSRQPALSAWAGNGASVIVTARMPVMACSYGRAGTDGGLGWALSDHRRPGSDAPGPMGPLVA